MDNIINTLKTKFAEDGETVRIPLMRKNKFFKASLDKDGKGINVSNLAAQPLLSWETFVETVKLLEANNGFAVKGSAMKGKLGDELLPLNSVEGNIASKIHKVNEGKKVFRRVSPVSGILVWAGICEHGRGTLLLKNNSYGNQNAN